MCINCSEFMPVFFKAAVKQVLITSHCLDPFKLQIQMSQK